MIVTKKLEYSDCEMTYEGVVAYDNEAGEKLPIVMVFHAYGGQSLFDENKAVALAKLGYVGFAVDYYGKGNRASNPDEAQKLMDKLNGDRAKLLRHIKTSVLAAKSIEQGDKDKVAAIGFCFGGKSVLDLVRSGEELCGVVSFHGVLDPPTINEETRIKTPILILHGWDDPLATPSAIVEVSKELTSKGADWELIAYGNTGHSFTNPKANLRERGMFYDKEADRKSWNRMKYFLESRFQ